MNGFIFNSNDFILSWISILLEGIPFLLLGTLISGFLEVFLPPRFVEKMLPRNPLIAVFMAAGLGIIFPMCECGIVPILKRLIRKGVPVASAVTYMLAAPIVNPITFLSTLAAFKGQSAWVMTSWRLGLGFLIASTVGWLLVKISSQVILKNTAFSKMNLEQEAFCHETFDKHSHENHSNRVFPLSRAIRCSINDFLDVAFYLVIGAGLAAVFNTAVNRQLIEPLASNIFTAMGGTMIGAVLLCLCSTSDAFIAATLKFPAAAKLAFLVYGPMFDLKLFLMYSVVFTRKFVLFLAIGLAIMTFVLCLLFHILGN